MPSDREYERAQEKRDCAQREAYARFHGAVEACTEMGLRRGDAPHLTPKKALERIEQRLLELTEALKRAEGGDGDV